MKIKLNKIPGQAIVSHLYGRCLRQHTEDRACCLNTIWKHIAWSIQCSPCKRKGIKAFPQKGY